MVCEHVRLYHQCHIGFPCAQLSCNDPCGVSEQRVCQNEDIRAYAFEPHNPCSSPANATTSTVEWNLTPSSLIRRAIASNEMVPEPSSLPPGACSTTMSPHDHSTAHTHSRVMNQTSHVNHSDQRPKRSTAGLPYLRIYFTQNPSINVYGHERVRRVPYQTTLGAKPTRKDLSSHVAPVCSNCSLSHAAATREPLENEWRDSSPDVPSSLVR